ncbi:glycerate kinase [Muriicola marianensis]|nr:glycerate kinase [Muriicola marianensis]
MRFVLIPDKFKGSLSAEEVINSLSTGIRGVYPDAEIASVIASDGGDGFLKAVARAIPVEEISVASVDPLGRALQSQYLWAKKEQTAYIELAECSGLVLLDPTERDPTRTSTLGTGLQIRHALENGAKRIYVGLGGSATNDGGLGIAHGLGFRFKDDSDAVLDPTGGNLGKIRSVEMGGVIEALQQAEVIAINDVQNPLLGPQGAAAVYASQKGSSLEQIGFLEAGLKNLDQVVLESFGKSAADLPGAGAAGGAAFGLHTFLNARFVKGVEFMLQLTQAEALFEGRKTDLLITGEGAIDVQTLHGKLIQGVSGLGKKYGVPVMAVCGKLDMEGEDAGKFGLEVILEIRDPSKSIQYSMENAATLLQQCISTYLKNRKTNR